MCVFMKSDVSPIVCSPLYTSLTASASYGDVVARNGCEASGCDSTQGGRKKLPKKLDIDFSSWVSVGTEIKDDDEGVDENEELSTSGIDSCASKPNSSRIVADGGCVIRGGEDSAGGMCNA
jgi:hypothetical protein